MTKGDSRSVCVCVYVCGITVSWALRRKIWFPDCVHMTTEITHTHTLSGSSCPQISCLWCSGRKRRVRSVAVIFPQETGAAHFVCSELIPWSFLFFRRTRDVSTNPTALLTGKIHKVLHKIHNSKTNTRENNSKQQDYSQWQSHTLRITAHGQTPVKWWTCSCISGLKCFRRAARLWKGLWRNCSTAGIHSTLISQTPQYTDWTDDIMLTSSYVWFMTDLSQDQKPYEAKKSHQIFQKLEKDASWQD